MRGYGKLDLCCPLLFFFFPLFLFHQLSEEVPLLRCGQDTVPTSNPGRLGDPVLLCGRVYPVQSGYKLPAQSEPCWKFHPAVSVICYLLCNKSNTVRGTCLNSHLIALYISLCYLNDTFCLTWLQNKQEIQLHCITIPTSGKLPGTIALCDSRLLLYITVLSQRNVHHRWGSLWVGEGLMTRNVQEASWKYTCERGCYECREFLILCSYITLKKSFSWVSSVFCTSNHLNKVLLSFWPLMTLSLDRVRFLFWMCGVCRFVWIAGL